jgi:hypothetical protein
MGFLHSIAGNIMQCTRLEKAALLIEHDLRANAFRVCREGKPQRTFPDDALVPHFGAAK